MSAAGKCGRGSLNASSQGTNYVPEPLVAVLDDDRDYLELMQMLLTDEAGCSVVTICGGDSACSLGTLEPRLIITDLFDPRSGYGWGSLEALTQDERTRNIPILLCTGATHELAGHEEWMRRHRIAVIRKPFDISEMVRTVRRLVGKDDASGSTSRDA